ncbi:hypothetical protein MMC29_006018 [Sticta canariensis]|nr:hypothetical protein [Sticta canariensis]
MGLLDASTLSLPLDIQSTEQDLQPVNLGSVIQNRPQLCSGGGPFLNMVNKRQKTTDCVAVDCGTNDYGFPESPMTDNQPVKWSYPFGNQEESLEVPVNLDGGNHENLFSEENNDWDDFLLNDATTNIFLSSSNEQGTLDQVEASISDITTDGTGNGAFEIATKKKDPASTFEQDPTTGEPLENSCPLLPEDRLDGYLVHLVEFQTPRPPRNPQAILVSQHLSPQRYKYDLAPASGARLLYRKVPNPIFISGGKVVVLSRFEQRGWLVTLPGEPVQIALTWFEALARGIRPPRSGTLPMSHEHYTTVWVTQVFKALARSNTGFWVPFSFPASTPP